MSFLDDLPPPFVPNLPIPPSANPYLFFHTSAPISTLTESDRVKTINPDYFYEQHKQYLSRDQSDFFFALLRDDLDRARQLVNQGTSPDFLITNINSIFYTFYGYDYMTPLSYASSIPNGVKEHIVDFLLDIGADPDLIHEDKNMPTPLTNAIYKNNISIVNKLLDNSADVNIPAVPNLYPIALACQLGNLELVQTLYEMGAGLDVYTDAGDSLYDMAINENNQGYVVLEIVKKLVEWGCPLVSKSENGNTLLKAIDAGFYDVEDYLADQGMVA